MPPMNGKTAKAIRRFAALKGLPYANAKLLWKKTPRPVRAIYRHQIIQEIHDFAHQLKRWRGHLTQKQAADKLDVPFDTYRNWEYRKNTPVSIVRLEIIKRMSA